MSDTGFAGLQEFLDTYAGRVANETLREWMMVWRNPFPAVTEGFLVQNGLEEHYGIGMRFESQYGSLLGTGGYNPLNTTFQNTQVERTALSAQSFAAGLYNQRGTLPNRAAPIFAYNLPKNADPTLRPFDMCPSFQQAFETAKQLAPVKAWLDQFLPAIAARFSNLFNTPVDSGLAKLMYEACGYEYAVLNKSQRFCSLFEEQDFKVFEYATDLEEYYTRSYGLPIAWQIASPLLNDLVSAMNAKFSAISAASQESRHVYASQSDTSSNLASFSAQSSMASLSSAGDSSTFFRFAHAETMEPLLSILGLYNDSSPLQASWNWEQIEARKFRTSWLFPFASNLAMLGYDCVAAQGLPERFYVKFQHNERDVVLPECRSSPSLEPFCGFEQFQQNFASKLSINFQQLCGLAQAPTAPTPVPSADLPKFQPIYVWGPCVLMATLFVSFLGGYCAGSRRPWVRRKEPLLAAMDPHYQ